MPIFEYKCEECAHRFEVRQHFDDDPITKCPNDGCPGRVHRVFSAPAIIFKGSGFYVNDYGRGYHKKSPEDDTSDEKSETPSQAAKTGTD